MWTQAGLSKPGFSGKFWTGRKNTRGWRTSGQCGFSSEYLPHIGGISMATTPQITLTATLDTIMGGGFEGGWLRITLCGYGPAAPTVPGAMLADAGIPQLLGPQAGGTALTIALFGND